ncbi:MAG: hypothetical protein ACTSRG_15550 [Candidatus Helarchaeota archaeon]
MINIIVAILQLIMSAGLIIFWINFLKVEKNNPDNSEIYLAHELSFPLPDLGLIAPTLIISAIGLLINNSIGIYFSLVSGGALMFLGLIDLAFNLKNGDLMKTKSDLITSYAIVILVFTMAIINLIYGWIEFQNLMTPF